MKMRQYKVGREFCDQVVDEAGMAALNLVWADPAALPAPNELNDPQLWLKRVAA